MQEILQLVLASLGRMYDDNSTIPVPTRTPSGEMKRRGKVAARAGDVALLAVNLSAALYVDATQSRLPLDSTVSANPPSTDAMTR
jgi:hypothetical protein